MKKSIVLIITFVCVLCLIACANTSTKKEKWDLLPMVMVDGVLYLDTGHNSTEVRKCGTPDGEITSTVGSTEKPVTDNQSNFGTGYGYQYGVTEGTIEVYMNDVDVWRIFATEEVRKQIQLSKEESKEELATGDLLEAIFYNGECYYGLLMTVQISKEEPEDFIYLGKISSVIKGYNSPTEELSSTYGKVGDEVYHYTDKRGNHYFCTPNGGDQYRCLYKATTINPGYYD